MKQDEATPIVFQLFQDWCAANEITAPDGYDAFRFYCQLNRQNPHVLNFRCRGDKWQTVHAWLCRARLVREKHEHRRM